MRLTKREQAELLFEEFLKISEIRKAKESAVWTGDSEIVAHKNKWQGSNAVSDGNKRYSGTFQRESHTLQARMLPSENVVMAETGYSSRLQLIGDDVASVTSGTDSLNEWTAQGSNNAVQPNEQDIHNTANNIAMAGDELNDEYKCQIQSATDGMIKKVKDKGSNLSYEVFRAVVDEVISQDQDMASFVFVLHLFSNVLSTMQQLSQVYPRMYIGEKYADEAAACIEGNS
ncbi:uncharacterized protein LOC135687632 [Rhopilema esculentum]|uniref:uncharacterized protein LOC135687632 n=1 Tax=Rhopilema esculentum TaxID=499914 RepID=UPI0031D9D095